MATLVTNVGRGGDEVRVFQVCLVEVQPALGGPFTVKLTHTPFRVGSHPTNDLVLDDDTVSKHHLEIEVVADGYRVVDLSSSNGTWLAGARLGEVVVAEPVELRLGTTTLRLTPAEEQVEIPAVSEPGFGRLIGRSVVMRELYAQLARLAEAGCPVLIEGETGSGKELAAEALHRASPRADGPFVVVDCAALAGDVADSELFGHLRGAFSGGAVERRGLVELAHGGTLFLDEVGELPLPLQSKLLGLLDRGEIVPVGADAPRTVDVRVVAATWRDLAREVNEERFRAELFYRLAVARVRVPPLRARLEDVPLLVESFLAELRQRGVADVPASLSSVALARLASHSWPGNVRELRNTLERQILTGAPQVPLPEPTHVEGYQAARDRFLAEFTERTLREALVRANGRVSQAARDLGIEERYLRRLLERHGIDHRAL